MKPRVLGTLGVIVLAIVVFGTVTAEAQTTAPGPYYATPSWDQQLPASTRFIVLSNWGSNAVLDRETGLVWERAPSTAQFTWFDASFHCLNLNTGGRMGWRLPTLQELMSLVDRSQSNPALPSGHPFTIATGFAPYWSATTRAVDANVAFGVSFFSGVWVQSFKDPANLPAWCVRGGQGVDPQ